jgi:hypothetical protein
MAILTRAELSHYPGTTPTEQALAEHGEGRLRAKPLASRALAPSRGADSLPRVLDLRPFPGRDRTERVMAWLVAHTPRAASWSQESLRELSERLVATGRIIE